MQCNSVQIRRQTSSDIEAVLKIIRATEFFRDCEIDIAREVLEQAIAAGSDYLSYTAVCGDDILGWVCFGKTPCTVATFDIYWLAVRKDCQGKGIGSKLVGFAQQQIADQGGQLIVIETSGSHLYAQTQKFYIANGYTLTAQVANFYAQGDDKLIFTKQL